MSCHRDLGEHSMRCSLLNACDRRDVCTQVSVRLDSFVGIRWQHCCGCRRCVEKSWWIICTRQIHSGTVRWVLTGTFPRQTWIKWMLCSRPAVSRDLLAVVEQHESLASKVAVVCCTVLLFPLWVALEGQMQ